MPCLFPLRCLMALSGPMCPPRRFDVYCPHNVRSDTAKPSSLGQPHTFTNAIRRALLVCLGTPTVFGGPQSLSDSNSTPPAAVRPPAFPSTPATEPALPCFHSPHRPVCAPRREIVGTLMPSGDRRDDITPRLHPSHTTAPPMHHRHIARGQARHRPFSPLPLACRMPPIPSRPSSLHPVAVRSLMR